MKNLTLIFSLFLLQHLSAQNNQAYDWTKDSRNNIFEESVGALSKNKKINKDQKETVALCCVDAITTKYSRKEFESKIDAEHKRIMQATLLQCSKNVGVELEEKEAESKPVNPDAETDPTKENMVGHWRTSLGEEYWFFKTGDFKVLRSNGKTEMGSWSIENINLTIVIKKKVENYRVVSFKTSKFVYMPISKKKDSFTATRID